MSTIVQTTYACGHPVLVEHASGIPTYVSRATPRVGWPCPDCEMQYVDSLNTAGQRFFDFATGCLRVAQMANPESQPGSSTDALETLGDELFAFEAELLTDRHLAMRQAQAVVFRDFLRAARLASLVERRAALRAAREELPMLARVPSLPRDREADLSDAEFFGRAYAVNGYRGQFDSVPGSPPNTSPDPTPDSSDEEEDDVYLGTFFDGTGDGHAMLDLLMRLGPDQRTRLIARTPQNIVQATIAARIERGEEPPWIHRGAFAVSMNINTVSGHATYRMSSGEVVSVILYNRFVWGVEARAFPDSMLQAGERRLDME